MITSEVQRTLVKSPPELWSELSDPAALGRHLGEFGQIRITRVEPETTVEWEAENASGAVVIKPSGWGTRVILKASRTHPAVQEAPDADAPDADAADTDEPAAQAPDAQPTADAESAQPGEPTPDLPPPSDPQTAPDAQPEPEAELPHTGGTSPDAASETTTAPEVERPMLGPATHAGLAHGRGLPQEPAWEDEPQEDQLGALEPPPRRGFFARLFGRRPRNEQSELERAIDEAPVEPNEEDPVGLEPDQGLDPAESTPAVEDVAGPAEELDAVPTALDEEKLAAAPQDAEETMTGEDGTSRDDHSGDPRQPADGAAELETHDQAAVEEVTAVLTSMLDRLGTAHHRPFSRA
jgi:hypothetical protein